MDKWQQSLNDYTSVPVYFDRPSFKEMQKSKGSKVTPEALNAFVDKIVVHEREKKDGKLCSAPNVKPPKYRRGRRKSMLLPIHIYFYPYLV